MAPGVSEGILHAEQGSRQVFEETGFETPEKIFLAIFEKFWKLNVDVIEPSLLSEISQFSRTKLIACILKVVVGLYQGVQDKKKHITEVFKY